MYFFHNHSLSCWRFLVISCLTNFFKKNINNIAGDNFITDFLVFLILINVKVILTGVRVEKFYEDVMNNLISILVDKSKQSWIVFQG